MSFAVARTMVQTVMREVDSSKEVEATKAQELEKEEAKEIPLREYQPKILCLSNLSVNDALVDLGAGINVIPYNLFVKLGLGETKPTRMNMDGENSVPLILGRPFLATSKAMIDVCDEKLKLRVGDETVTFNLHNPISQSLDHNNVVYVVNVINDDIETQLQEALVEDPLHVTLLRGEKHELSNEEVLEQLEFMLANEPSGNTDEFTVIDNIGMQKLRPSLEEPLVLYLKELPQRLDYTHMDEDNGQLVIPVADLKTEEILLDDPLQVALQAEDEHELPNESVFELLTFLLANEPSKNSDKFVEIDRVGVQILRPSLEEPPVLELKDLPKHLNYAYLDGDSRLPIILEVDLTHEERAMTLASLRKRMAIGLRNALVTFQRCMMVIFHDMIEESIEVFMDDSSAFELLKEKLTTAPIMVSPNWGLLFKLYTTTEKELLVVVFAFGKFRSYLVLSKTITDHSEFDIEINDKKGAQNLTANHLSRLENSTLEALHESAIDDNFLDEFLCLVQVNSDIPWFSGFANYMVTEIHPKDQVIRSCVYGEEILQILRQCHEGPTGGTMAERRERPRKVGLSKRRRSYPIDQPAPTLAPHAPAPRPKGP
eukprot:XP_015582575.1 uncharacterized protein LOC107262269 [Ricinus communis]